MAAGLGFKTFNTGEVLTSADVNGYLMQGVLVFASEAARNAAITSPQEGQFAYTKDNNSLWYYTGSAWAASGATGDIEGVTAGTGISGGGTSGTVTITNSMATAIDAKGDLVVGTGADTFARLAVGTNGHTLVADSVETTGLKWAAPAGAANYTLLNSGGTATTSGNTVTISSISGKDKFLVYLVGNSSTGQANYTIRINGDTGSNYYYTGFRQATPTTYNAQDASLAVSGNADTSFYLGNSSGNAGSAMFAYMTIEGGNSAGLKIVQAAAGYTTNGSAGLNNTVIGGYYDSASTISSISILTNSTFDAGTIYIYASA